MQAAQKATPAFFWRCSSIRSCEFNVGSVPSTRAGWRRSSYRRIQGRACASASAISLRVDFSYIERWGASCVQDGGSGGFAPVLLDERLQREGQEDHHLVHVLEEPLAPCAIPVQA